MSWVDIINNEMTDPQGCMHTCLKRGNLTNKMQYY